MPRKKKQIDLSDLPFEEALMRLETIVKEMESGELPLEEALQQFSQGVALSQLCLGQLQHAEAAMDKILQEESGVLREKPLEMQED